MMTTRRHKETMPRFLQLMQFTVWGFTIVISSVVFLLAGYWLDGKLGTQPTFTMGLFLLAVILSIGRLYQDAWNEMKKQQ